MLTTLEFERRKRSMTQASLGARAHVDPCAISRAERHALAYPGHLKRLAAALDWKGEPADLLQEVK